MRGVRQVCVVGPFINNITTDYLWRRSVDCSDRGFQFTDNFGYADDPALVAYDEKTMHYKVQSLNNEIEEFRIEIPVKSKKCLIVGSTTNKPLFTLPGGPIEQVNGFKYLGRIIDADIDQRAIVNNSATHELLL